MKTLLTSMIVFLFFIPMFSAAFADALADDQSKDKVAPVAPLKAHAFPLEDVRLLDGPFKHAMELDRQYLLSLDVDRLLHNFRVNAGLPSSAEPLGGWEEPKGELRGHFVGHYLTACALMYASTGDERLKQKGDAVVAGLAECQAKIGTGYLSAYPEEFFDRVESLKQVWAPYYTLHKIYAGLLDMYIYCGNQQALETCKKFADWVIARNDRLSDEQMQKMLGTEHGGMNEVLANLYALTGEEKYLKIAQRFNHMAVIGPAAKQEDKLTGLHANTQFPKFIGTARQYELTGEDWLKTATLFFWNTVVKERSYVIGGNSDNEAFSPKERLSKALGPNTTETCNTYNMLKLTRHLFCWDPQAQYADYYERALYNHILASQNPETGMMCYYVPLRSGSRKNYNGPLDAFWCCTGTGVENHAKYGDSIYFHDDKNLFVNLFIASELNWKAKGLKLRQETKYPDESSTVLAFICKQPVELSLQIRHPWWATKDFEILINGEKQAVSSKPGSYAVVARTWKTGDVVEISLPFSLYTEGFRDNPQRFAFMYGPLVLCAEVDAKQPFSAVVAEEDQVLAGLKPVAGKASTFTGLPEEFRIAGQKDGSGVTLEPFYKMHGSRHYVVYWDLYTSAQWQVKEKEYEAELARQKELEARTIDTVTPGYEQNERDHNLQGEHASSGDYNGGKWRHAIDGGWFSWEVKVLPDQPHELRVTYWGGDAGNRVFDILIDDAKLATQRLQNNKPGTFYEEIYQIPAEMTKGKEKVTVKFQAHPGAWAGGSYGLRILKKPVVTLRIQADQPGARISPTMWGVFFEDINFGADGGLYAELVKNRSFECANPMLGWSNISTGNIAGIVEIHEQDPFNAANPHYLRVKVYPDRAGGGVSNEGFRGMGLREGEDYAFSAQVRAVEGQPALRIELAAGDGRKLAEARLAGFTKQWKKITAILKAAATEPQARLNIYVEGPGAVDLDMVSLFPLKTWKNRPGGLRADMVQMLADLKPGFLRFPGGCIVEGRWLDIRYQWKTTIGDIPERKLIINRWNNEFRHRPTPDYFQSFGLGFCEYFQLCEDIGAEPLPILNCGMACQFNSGELAPMDQLEPYIQDALDLIEFANGPATSTWGKKRAEMGHPQPFNMKLLGVGNEQWGLQYIERYERFAKVLKEKHPEIKLVSSAGPEPADERFKFAWAKLRELKADIVDEHCYAKPEWFFNSAARYDKYDRKGPKVFMGEYAAQSVNTASPNNRNTWECALSEAAFMTGLERNADVVVMSSYAPLLAHLDAWQWTPDLIWCDNLNVYGTPSYYVQQMFSRNRGNVVLPVKLTPEQQSDQRPYLYATASREDTSGTVILKVVNAAADPAEAIVQVNGAGKLPGTASVTILAGTSLADENSLVAPKKVAPASTRIEGIGPEFKFTFKPWSLTVLRLPPAWIELAPIQQ